MIKKTFFAIKNLLAAHEDAKLNRTLAGIDRYGNKYYQYYDNKGKECKRILEPNPHASETFDPIWSDWLRFHQKNPYTAAELKNFYDIETMSKKKAFEYEIKDAEMMKEYREEYKKSQENEKTTFQKGSGEKYNPGGWKPINKNRQK